MARRRPAPAVLTARQRLVGWWGVLLLVGFLLAAAFGLAWGLIAALGVKIPAAAAPLPAASPTAAADPAQAARDELAAAPMTSLPQAAARPQALVAEDPATGLLLPVPAGTPAGSAQFPRTPEGAVAALAAIDAAALQPDPATARRVWSSVALPGAVPERQWTPAVAVHGILSAAHATAGDDALTAQFTPTHGQVKGVLDDGGFVVACVLGELDVTYDSAARSGLGDCQRLQWTAAGWRIAAGAQPAWAPSAWPGSADCVRAGWRPLQHG